VKKANSWILATLVAVGATPAFAAQNGFFVNGSVGQSRVDAFDVPGDLFNEVKGDATASGLNVGYRWGWFGVEVGYADPGSVSKTFTIGGSAPSFSWTDKGHIHGTTTGINAHYDFLPNWYVSGRAGAFHWNGSELTYIGFNNIGTGAPIMTRQTGSHTDWYGGAGIGYDFSQQVGIGVAYDRYKALSRTDQIDLTSRVWSLTAEYRF
jgi:OOP family OmpA-OmpF porin/outer membrane immunogenic protein